MECEENLPLNTPVCKTPQSMRPNHHMCVNTQNMKRTDHTYSQRTTPQTYVCTYTCTHTQTTYTHTHTTHGLHTYAYTKCFCSVTVITFTSYTDLTHTTCTHTVYTHAHTMHAPHTQEEDTPPCHPSAPLGTHMLPHQASVFP